MSPRRRLLPHRHPYLRSHSAAWWPGRWRFFWLEPPCGPAGIVAGLEKDESSRSPCFLSKISRATPTRNTSKQRYKDTTKSLPEISRELNVDAVIEGSVLRDGNRVRISVELVVPPLWLAQSRSGRSHPLSDSGTNCVRRFPIPAPPADDSLGTLPALSGWVRMILSAPGGCTDLSLKRLSCHETRCSELTQPDVDQNFAKINRFVAKASIGPYKYRKPRMAASNPRLRYGVVRSQSR